MKFLFVLFILQSTVATATGTASHFAATPRRSIAAGDKPSAQTAVLKIRGGAGPIPPMKLAKGVTVLSLVNAAANYLLPGKISEAYRTSATTSKSRGTTRSRATNDEDILLTLIVKRVGVASLSLALMSYCLLFHGSSTKAAVGVSTLPPIIDLLASELGGDPETYGWPKYMQLLPVAISAAAAYACFDQSVDSSLVQTAIKVYAAFMALSGAQAFIAPDSFTKTWKIQSRNPPLQSFLFRMWGSLILGVGVMAGALTVDGVETISALGYAMISTLIVMLGTALSGGYEEIGLDGSMMMPWILIKLVAIPTFSL